MGANISVMATNVGNMDENIVSLGNSVETISYSMPAMTSAVVDMSANSNRMSYDISQAVYAFIQPMSYMWGSGFP